MKGITDVESLSEWDQPFPMNLADVTPRDDEYWAKYRATPKMFFSLTTARKLWPSRYGSLTSVRVPLKTGQSFEEGRDALAKYILDHIDPTAIGLSFQPVKLQGLRAASGATDFTGLFIGFSFFLILSAVILVGLLFRLTIDQRVQQYGLLGAIGLPPSIIRRMILEKRSGAGAGLAAFLGAFAAIGYAQLMLYGLKTWWICAIGTRFLFLSIQPVSVIAGAVIAGISSLIAMATGLWQLRKVSLRSQLNGVSEAPRKGTQHARAAAIRAGVAFGLALAAARRHDACHSRSGGISGLSWPIVVFFVAGLLLLSAVLWGLSAWLQRVPHTSSRAFARHGLTQLGLRMHRVVGNGACSRRG